MALKIGLFLDSDPKGGGTFQYSQAILEALYQLDSSKFKVIVYFTNPAWGKVIQQYTGIHAFYINTKSIGFYVGKILRQINFGMSLWRKFAKRIDSVTRDILQVGAHVWIFPAQDAWAYQIPVKSIVPIHDLMHRYERRFPEVGSSGIYRRREGHYKWICKWSNGILVDSLVGRQHVIDSYRVTSEKIFILPFIPPKYVYDGKSDVNVFEKFQLPEKFLFYPAQFWAHKNHLNIVKAFAILSRKIPDICIAFSGSPKNGYRQLVAKVAEMDLNRNIRFLGYVTEKDIISLYKQARGMVMASFCGPTNIPPLEAFVCGCPVAVSDVYGMPAQVGDAALLFDPSSPNKIADACYRLWNDDNLCDELIQKGKEKIQNWGPLQFSEKLKDIILTVTN